MNRSHIVALPRLRLACRSLDPALDDADLVLAEAAAVLSWARLQGRASAAWLVIDGAAVDVAAPLPVGVDLPPGAHERWLEPGRWAALDADGRAPSVVKATASSLRAAPPEPLAGHDEPVFARLTEGGATVHLRIV